MTAVHRSGLLTGTAAGILLLSSCVFTHSPDQPGRSSPSIAPSSTTPPPDRVLPLEDQSLTLAPGETAHVQLGEVNTSVGDSWGALEGYDTDVVSTDVVLAGCGELDGSGCTGPNALVIEALAPGTTIVQLQYCFRTQIVEGCPGGSGDGTHTPIQLEVTVQ